MFEIIIYLYYYIYENFCFSIQLFLNHFEADRDTVWHKVAFGPTKVLTQNNSFDRGLH